MADRVKPPSNAGMKPVPMKLFATWEVDRTAPNCIPRLCTLTLTRLVLLKSLGSDLTSIIIAVKMQSSKRTLRSNEIFLPSSELLDTELDLTFSLQYPHFLKRDGNKLQIMLQRRKKYKNRTILGFKTLAVGFVNMSQVLQRAIDKELELYTDMKEKNSVVAKVMMLTLTSQPVDHEEPDSQKLASEPVSPNSFSSKFPWKLTNTPVIPPVSPDRSVDVDNFSDEDEDFSSNDDGSDSEPMIDDGVSMRKSGSRQSLPIAARQRNLKQKFIALLKRFKVTDEALDSEHDQEIEQKSEHDMDPQEIEDLFDELEDLSDSGPDMDTVSIMSTPKPSLRPFFPSSRSLIQDGVTNPEKQAGTDRLSDESSKKADSDGHPDALTDHEYSDPQQTTVSPPGSGSGEEKKGAMPDKRSKLFNREKSSSNAKEKRVSLSKDKIPVDRSNSLCQQDSSPRKILLEQLSKIFPTDDYIPDYIILVNTVEMPGQLLAQRLQEKQHRVICTGTPADVRATIVCLVNKIQKFCNTNSKAPLPIKVAVAGNDNYIHSVVRPYVEQFSSKSPEWQNYIKFLIIPVGTNHLANYLGILDPVYQSTFLDSSWKDGLEKSDLQKPEFQEIVNRVNRYINNVASIVLLPIAEAMVNYKEKGSNEESSQVFIPFINDVKIGVSESSAPSSVDLDEATSIVSVTSSSPPSSASHLEKPKDITPPSSPNINYPISQMMSSSQTIQSMLTTNQESLDLLIDYWITQIKGDSNKKTDSNKNTLKATFRSLQFLRLPNSIQPNPLLTMNYVTKEKKQKIMRLGKKKEKEKESESKSTVVEGINRLICLSRAHRLKVSIDGTEWHGVKFFQLSAQWQTHIKHFPVALFVPVESTL